MNPYVIRLQNRGFAQADFGGGELVRAALDEAALDPHGCGQFAAHGEELVVGCGGGEVVFAVVEGVGEVGQRVGLVGGAGEGVAIALDGAVALADGLEGEAEIVEQSDGGGQGERALVFGDGIARAPRSR